MLLRHVALALPFLFLVACQTATDGDGAGTGKTLAEKEASTAARGNSKSASLTETAVPNKPANATAADVESEDLAALKAELNALSGDISKMRGDLDEGGSTAPVTPDTQISTPRALVTDGIIGIPDSKQELAMARAVTVQGVRVGAHSDKTRLVFDLSAQPDQKPDVSLSGNLLKIKIFDAKWTDGGAVLASQTKSLGVSNVTEERDDVVVTIDLTQNATLKAQMVLPPADVGGPFRLVVDLVPGT